MRIISGQYKGRILKTTVGPGFRPAMGKVREALFSMLEARGLDWAGVRVLDLFAGSGSLGFEALSRGADYACFVESAPHAVRVIKANAALLGIGEERFEARLEDAGKALARSPAEGFSLVFIDPPYQTPVLGSVLRSLLKNAFVRPGGFINAEIKAGLDFAPENMDSALQVLGDRAYGQTRVVLWRMREI
ncbi:MAG: 16S rRNA (guanine(966)-N(2))-methyltransferase RsmD [Desulfovibrio sp.]|jgi:16S rRNA (guanine966-N2)-methyltransferase|nr:16S rRNA (guanine(966)-N(2))-methyltransferase RsmD [Desulfovibrio sp.]